MRRNVIVCVRTCAILSVVCVFSTMRVRSRLAVVDATPRAKDDDRRLTKPTVASASVQRARSNPLSSWLAITSVCVDEGDKRAPDGQQSRLEITCTSQWRITPHMRPSTVIHTYHSQARFRESTKRMFDIINSVGYVNFWIITRGSSTRIAILYSSIFVSTSAKR